MSTLVKLDTRGRLVIPSEYRTPLGLKEGDDVLLSIDYKTDTLSIVPVLRESKGIVKIEIEFGDDPGCLARTADKLADLGVDLIQTESKSSARGQKATWDIYADITGTGLTSKQLIQQVSQSGYVDSMNIVNVARNGVEG